MDLPSQLTVLRQRPCTDPVCEMDPILMEGHVASRFHAAEMSNGLPLCKTHRDIYQTLRTNQPAMCCNLAG